jgi:FMN phosphatase YigB (HAD superfamily)
MPDMHTPLRAILFDLDGTLLDNNINTFLPHYFQRLSAKVAHILPPDQFIACLLQATRAMIANDGRATNEQVFAEVFYPLLGRPREEMEPIFMDFYAHDFASLRQYTARKPEARQVVQKAFDLGYDVVIATNPLFPATAIAQRMEWAGVDGFPYRLVTSYENSRTCKPNLAYYQRILETIGHPAQACLVVGNEAMDMVAGRLGCATFFIPDSSAPLDPSIPEPTCRGTLSDLVELLPSWK